MITAGRANLEMAALCYEVAINVIAENLISVEHK